MASPLSGRAQGRIADAARLTEVARQSWEEAGCRPEKAPLRVRGLVIFGSAAALWAAILLVLV